MYYVTCMHTWANNNRVWGNLTMKLFPINWNPWFLITFWIVFNVAISFSCHCLFKSILSDRGVNPFLGWSCYGPPPPTAATASWWHRWGHSSIPATTTAAGGHQQQQLCPQILRHSAHPPRRVKNAFYPWVCIHVSVSTLYDFQLCALIN